MDTDGDQIHGWIPRRLAANFEPHVFENNVLCIKNFNVIERKNKYYSPLKNQYNIIFTERTQLEPISEYVRFPPQPFQFTHFADLHPLVGQKTYLTDVIGMFEYLGQTKQLTSTKKLREVFIRNTRDEALKINFWDENIGIIPQTLANDGSTPILAVTSTTASNFGGTISVNVSQGTKVFVDPNILAAAELKAKIAAQSPGMPQKRLLPSDAIRTIKDVHTALAKETMGFNLCRATIQHVYEDEGWKYHSCTKCRRKLTLSGNNYWCFKCNTEETNPDERFKLQLQIGDRYGIIDVTAFSEAAGEMLEISMKDMNAINEKPQTGQDEVRAEISKIVGREYLFRIKIDDYNLKNPEKALTVSSISNVREPQQNRMRTAPTAARQLSFSTPSVVAENLPTKISNAPTTERSQNNTGTDTSTTQPTASPITTAATSFTSSQQ